MTTNFRNYSRALTHHSRAVESMRRSADVFTRQTWLGIVQSWANSARLWLSREQHADYGRTITEHKPADFMHIEKGPPLCDWMARVNDLPPFTL